MTIKHHSTFRAALLMTLLLIITIASTQIRADSGSCAGGNTTLPFTDVMGNPFFCDIAEAFFSGLTNGTTPTTYSPGQNVPREQMAAFVTRTLDQSLKRGSRRAALKQFWTPTSEVGFGLTPVGVGPVLVESDGGDLWVTNSKSEGVSRVRASDGKLLETWTGAPGAIGVLAAKGLIFVTGGTTPGSLYRIDPTQPAGAVATLTSALGDSPVGIAFDGARIWTANTGGSVSIVTLDPLSVTNVTVGFISPIGILYDGNNMWVTDTGSRPGNLFKLDSSGAIIQTVTVGDVPELSVFDGTNIWVPNFDALSVTVVRASTGTVLATLTGNGLVFPQVTAFDGERILVTSKFGNSVSLWKAADLSPLGTLSTGTGTNPTGVCSDGLNFWIVMQGIDKLARF
ncbi:MAG TPA: hypothetical protein VN937_26015 [Blastocatellia bacterium]|nr:hypothetical protein [Blastocatellia bacterium]